MGLTRAHWPWMAKMKTKTLDQVTAMQRKAVRFLRDVVGDEDKANEVESLSPEAYAERKRVHLGVAANPNSYPRRIAMTRKTRAELEDEVRDLKDYVGELEEKLDTIADLAGEEDEDEQEEDDEDDGDDDEVAPR